ncbi:hypothetical protein F4808DRAFT_467445 [Astrocystis sublimbata]|nr:hypothetical protein F4808DRAFT_467445 [Astrocystis sublimbata]
MCSCQKTTYLCRCSHKERRVERCPVYQLRKEGNCIAVCFPTCRASIERHTIRRVCKDCEDYFKSKYGSHHYRQFIEYFLEYKHQKGWSKLIVDPRTVPREALLQRQSAPALMREMGAEARPEVERETEVVRGSGVREVRAVRDEPQVTRGRPRGQPFQISHPMIYPPIAHEASEMERVSSVRDVKGARGRAMLTPNIHVASETASIYVVGEDSEDDEYELGEYVYDTHDGHHQAPPNTHVNSAGNTALPYPEDTDDDGELAVQLANHMLAEHGKAVARGAAEATSSKHRRHRVTTPPGLDPLGSGKREEVSGPRTSRGDLRSLRSNREPWVDPQSIPERVPTPVPHSGPTTPVPRSASAGSTSLPPGAGFFSDLRNDPASIPAPLHIPGNGKHNFPLHPHTDPGAFVYGDDMYEYEDDEYDDGQRYLEDEDYGDDEEFIDEDEYYGDDYENESLQSPDGSVASSAFVEVTPSELGDPLCPPSPKPKYWSQTWPLGQTVPELEHLARLRKSVLFLRGRRPKLLHPTPRSIRNHVPNLRKTGSDTSLVKRLTKAAKKMDVPNVEYVDEGGKWSSRKLTPPPGEPQTPSPVSTNSSFERNKVQRSSNVSPLSSQGSFSGSGSSGLTDYNDHAHSHNHNTVYPVDIAAANDDVPRIWIPEDHQKSPTSLTNKGKGKATMQTEMEMEVEVETKPKRTPLTYFVETHLDPDSPTGSSARVRKSPSHEKVVVPPPQWSSGVRRESQSRPYPHPYSQTRSQSQGSGIGNGEGTSSGPSAPRTSYFKEVGVPSPQYLQEEALVRSAGLWHESANGNGYGYGYGYGYRYSDGERRKGAPVMVYAPQPRRSGSAAVQSCSCDEEGEVEGASMGEREREKCLPCREREREAREGGMSWI